MLATVRPLMDFGGTTGLCGYDRFFKQFRRFALTYKWPAHILDETMPDLTQVERDALDKNNPADLKTLLDIQNAYMVITTKCDGHQVEHLLETVEESRARTAVDTIREYFYPNSTAGRRSTIKKFHNATMANSSTNIISWVALVRQNAKHLRGVGGSADEADELSVLLNGLLPEFDKIKLILDETDGLTLQRAITKLTNHARSNDLLEVAKGKAAAPVGAKVFFGDSTEAAQQQQHGKQGASGSRGQPPRRERRDTKAEEERYRAARSVGGCVQWITPAGCPRGDACRYSHSDPAGKLKGSVRDSTKSTPQTKHQQNQEQARTVSWARPPASSYTAQEQAASTYAAHAEPAGPHVPTVCYTCFSHDHDTSQCTLHQHTTAMFAKTQVFDTEPPTTTEDARS